MNPRTSRYLLLLLIGFCLVTVHYQQRGLNQAREKLGLTRVRPLENAPPVLAFTTVALGSFRGLIANMLWIRAGDLQEKDKYFEMVQLSDWITKLQPYIPTVWYHLAWNMAYNISIKFHTPEDRWPWVLRGIQLLRDEGLKYNPHETLLYRELAWFFQHKIGHNLDDAHMYYKQIWGTGFARVLDQGRPNYNELLNPQTDEARRKAELLKNEYKMDPAIMKEADENYGPFEWRLPEAHAIYWAMAGQKHAKKQDQITLRRVIFQSMQLAFARGGLIENKVEQTFTLGPNLDIIPNASKAYEDMMAQEPAEGEMFRTGHRNFLLKAVYHLYTFNRKRDAQRWYDYTKEKYPAAVPTNQSLDEFAVAQVTEDAGETNMDETTAVIRGLLVNSFLELTQDEDDRSVNFELMARRVWQRYQGATARSKDRIGLPPMSTLKQQVLDSLLDLEQGLSPAMNAVLRTKLGLPAAAAPPAPNPTPPPPTSPSGSPLPSPAPSVRPDA